MKTEEEKDKEALHANATKYLDMLSKRPYPEDPAYEVELNRMNREAAEIIQRQTDRSLKPIQEKLNKAIAEANRLLKK